MRAILTEAGVQRWGVATLRALLQAADAGEQAAEACVGSGVAAEAEQQRQASREEGEES